MSLASTLLARAAGLPRAQTEDVVCEQDLRVTMHDGAVLLADRWVQRGTRDEPQPTVLVRSPYGRRQVFGLIFGRTLAERGLQIIVQSTRGTFDSEGEFNPFEERADGLATLDWIRAQPWHAERIALLGPSYLGLAVWAVAPEAGDDLAALAIQVGPSQFHGATFPGGGPALETAGSWLALIDAQERRLVPLAIASAVARLPKHFMQLPLGNFDVHATGAEVQWYREALSSLNRDDPFWAARDYARGVANVTAPVQLIGGWHDVFLPWMLEDFAVRQAAGRTTQLIVGPWVHTSPGLIAAGMREALAWLRAHVLGDDRLVRRDAISVFITGEPAGGWRALESWPPPDTGERRLWVGAGGRLQDIEPDDAPAAGDRYRYDPAHPTPSLGGPHLLARRPIVDNRLLEARADVLTYTAPPLTQAVEAIGVARVELHVRASAPYFDLFARVCDVDRDGASRNVCDALARVAPRRFEQAADGSWHVAFDLWPMGHRFAAGHRIRLQVSSGAHPRYARNPGTGESPMTATALQAVELELLHGARHPSVLVLPAAPPRAPTEHASRAAAHATGGGRRRVLT
ncbi:MAG: CocE/NonD family hydrolase [Actinomycetota bacterium]|nr:CocE/NonD family hydrolase [Actinomycetota bacterium]